MASRMKEKYQKELVARLVKKMGYTNVMAVPALKKITLNIGFSSQDDKKVLSSAFSDLYKITGLKPIYTQSRISVAGFKLRKGVPIGVKVTLRGEHMYEFLDRLISIVIPRIRDFRGFSCRAFDGRGSFSMGIKEQMVFPEIGYDEVDAVRGLDICFTTSAKSDYEGYELLSAFGFPFRERTYPPQLLKKQGARWESHLEQLEQAQKAV